MTQFTFTAGTIHLLAVANGKNIDGDTECVKGCIAALHSIGQTWKCAFQSGNVLERLLREWHPSSSTITTDTDTTRSNISEQGRNDQIDVERMLQQNPQVARQLRRLGWAPPRADFSPNPMTFVPESETVLTTSSFPVSYSQQRHGDLFSSSLLASAGYAKWIS